MKNRRLAILGALTLVMLASAVAQQASKHVLSSDELKKAVPAEYFFRGQKAPVQVRNAGRISTGRRQDDVGRPGGRLRVIRRRSSRNIRACSSPKPS